MSSLQERQAAFSRAVVSPRALSERNRALPCCLSGETALPRGPREESALPWSLSWEILCWSLKGEVALPWEP